MSTVSTEQTECPPDFQRINLEVRCPANLIENSEELKTIFHSGAKPVTCFIQIVKTKDDCSFEGRFVSHQVAKTQRSVPAEEDTLKVQEEESLFVGPNDDSTSRNTAASNDTVVMSFSSELKKYVAKLTPFNNVVVSCVGCEFITP